MLIKDEAKVDAWGAIADLFGVDYDDVEYEYFMGFESEEGLWTVFAKVLVNRETKEVTFLDYKTPDGKRMENPIKPISFA